MHFTRSFFAGHRSRYIFFENLDRKMLALVTKSFVSPPLCVLMLNVYLQMPMPVPSVDICPLYVLLWYRTFASPSHTCLLFAVPKCRPEWSAAVLPPRRNFYCYSCCPTAIHSIRLSRHLALSSCNILSDDYCNYSRRNFGYSCCPTAIRSIRLSRH